MTVILRVDEIRRNRLVYIAVFFSFRRSLSSYIACFVCAMKACCIILQSDGILSEVWLLCEFKVMLWLAQV